jgi:hypothetical protein
VVVVRVEESDRRLDLLGILELTDTRLEALDVLTQELCASLALAIVVFTAITLLGTDTLLAGGLDTIAALKKKKEIYEYERAWETIRCITHHLPLATVSEKHDRGQEKPDIRRDQNLLTGIGGMPFPSEGRT